MSNHKSPHKFTFERTKVTKYVTFEMSDSENVVTVSVYASFEPEARRIALEISESLENDNQHWDFKLISIEPSE